MRLDLKRASLLYGWILREAGSYTAGSYERQAPMRHGLTETDSSFIKFSVYRFALNFGENFSVYRFALNTGEKFSVYPFARKNGDQKSGRFEYIRLKFQQTENYNNTI